MTAGWMDLKRKVEILASGQHGTSQQICESGDACLRAKTAEAAVQIASNYMVSALPSVLRFHHSS